MRMVPITIPVRVAMSVAVTMTMPVAMSMTMTAVAMSVAVTVTGDHQPLPGNRCGREHHRGGDGNDKANFSKFPPYEII